MPGAVRCCSVLYAYRLMLQTSSPSCLCLTYINKRVTVSDVPATFAYVLISTNVRCSGERQ